MKIFVINGPNLNMLGIREPAIYGSGTYKSLVEMIEKNCRENGDECEFFQSNHEGALVDEIQRAYFDGADGIVINPGAYTHTSIALLDAVKAVKLPVVEVHISDVDAERASAKQAISAPRALQRCPARASRDIFTPVISFAKITKKGRRDK